MITVTLRGLGDDRTMEARGDKAVRLRALQKSFCALFGQRFPAMMATLNVQGEKFDSFNEQPFSGCTGNSVEAVVAFVPTDDPFFYDLMDRRGPKAVLEQTILAEVPPFPDGDTDLQ